MTTGSHWQRMVQAVRQCASRWGVTRGVPILMYHALGHPGEPASTYVLPVRRFARQLRWLALARYRVLSLDEYLALRGERRRPPRRSVILTFDDGYADNVTLGLPLLRRYGFPATIFAVSGLVGDVNRWSANTPLAGRPLLDWDAMAEAMRAGISIGAHTRTHPALTRLAPARVREEVAGARADLEQRLGCSVTTFAYPYGDMDAAAVAAVQEAGYVGACTSRSGTNDPATPAHELRRLEIRGDTSFPDFMLMVAFGTRVAALGSRVAALGSRMVALSSQWAGGPGRRGGRDVRPTNSR